VIAALGSQKRRSTYLVVGLNSIDAGHQEVAEKKRLGDVQGLRRSPRFDGFSSCWRFVWFRVVGDGWSANIGQALRILGELTFAVDRQTL